MRVAVVGLGKLGAPLATVFASKGHSVIGLDYDEVVVKSINNGTMPVEETGLQALFDQHRWQATTSYVEMVQKSDMAFILVPTPSIENGSFTNKYVIEAVRSLGLALSNKKKPYVVVVCSTVMPGSTAGPIQNALEEASGKQVGVGLGLCYSPEFIALGSVIQDLQHPDVVLIGESNEGAGKKLAAFMRTINDAPIKRMSIPSAEVAKIGVNAFVTMKISYANVLAEICENIPGADATVVTNAIGTDARIGRKYLSPGVSFGGPCFPRDTHAFAALANGLNSRADLAEATHKINNYQVRRIINIIKKQAQDRNVSVLGLTYKVNTPIREESFGEKLVLSLKREAFNVTSFDVNTDNIGNLWQTYAASVLVIALPDPAYKNIVPTCFEGRPNLIVIDCWDITERGPWDDLNVFRIGVG